MRCGRGLHCHDDGRPNAGWLTWMSKASSAIQASQQRPKVARPDWSAVVLCDDHRALLTCQGGPENLSLLSSLAVLDNSLVFRIHLEHARRNQHTVSLHRGAQGALYSNPHGAILPP